MIWAILTEKKEDEVYVNQGEALTDLQILIKFLLNFLNELVMSSLGYFRNPVKLLPSENYSGKIACFRNSTLTQS